MLDVAAAVLRQPGGSAVLLTRRLPHKPRGGLWEFPGGKIEPGETAAGALARELAEELGIAIAGSRRLFEIEHHYPDLAVRLHLREVRVWSGELQALEVAEQRWVEPVQASAGLLPLAAADARVARLLNLPQHCAITPDCAPGQQADWLQRIGQGIARQPGRLCLLRVPGLPAAARPDLYRALLQQLPPALHGALLVSGDPALAAALGLGVQLQASQLCQPGPQWPVVPGWRGASCHDAAELAAAAQLGCDYAMLAPVQPTATHPGAPPLGWERFAQLAAGQPLPLFALGGVDPAALALASSHGAWGVAGIRAFWGAPG